MSHDRPFAGVVPSAETESRTVPGKGLRTERGWRSVSPARPISGSGRPGEGEPGGGEPGTGVAEPEADTRTRPAPRYKVFIHNDPVTPMEFVVMVLERIFALSQKRAVEVMLEAHTQDVALVGAYSLEQAEFRVEQAHSLARGAGYPLTFTYEPE